jgi:glycosyltransferase involved in cell wall biosynthesis
VSANAVYISYDGALDPLGRSQIVPYLEGLARRGWVFDLVTFEKADRYRDVSSRAAMEERLRASGVQWHPLRYHKWPSVVSTVLDLVIGVRHVRRLVRRHSARLLHARSYPSALVARIVRRSEGIPYVFDMRGFYAEERVDGDIWRAGGLLYRTTKRVESGLLRDAAAVVTLTQASVPVLRRWLAAAGGDPLLRVIPTCVDLGRFRPADPPAGGFQLAYFGSIGTWYLLDEMLRFAAVVLEAAGGGQLLFLSNGDPALIRARAAAVAPKAAEVLLVDSVEHERVPAALAGAAATFFFVRPGPSRFGFHQTKLGESLALGLPVVANRGLGDTEILEADGVGVLLDPFCPDAYAPAARRLVELVRRPDTRRRCRAVAEARYDLERGVDAYASLYDALASGPAAT